MQLRFIDGNLILKYLIVATFGDWQKRFDNLVQKLVDRNLNSLFLFLSIHNK